jgi:hypothetical protein
LSAFLPLCLKISQFIYYTNFYNRLQNNIGQENAQHSFAFIFVFFVAAFVRLLVAKTEENANVKTLTASGFLLFVGYVGCFVD